MRRCIVYLCVFLALTACSPKSISGERAVRTSSTIEQVEDTAQETVLTTGITSAPAVRGEAFTEERRDLSVGVPGWMPWYVYVAGMIGALLVGFVLGVRGGRWIKMKLK